MSFIKIKDPKERDKIFAEYLQIKKNIHAANRRERIGEIETERTQEKLFKPLIKETQNILQKIPIVTNEKTSTQKLIPIVTNEKTSTQLPMIMGLKIKNLGGIAKRALSKAFSNDKDYDKKWGIRSKDNKFFMGNKEVKFVNNDIIVEGKRYEGTIGLWDLITLKEPQIYLTKEYKLYGELLSQTNAYRKNHDPNSNYPNSDKSSKWKIIAPLWHNRKRRAYDTEQIESSNSVAEQSLIPVNLSTRNIEDMNVNELLEEYDLLVKNKPVNYNKLEEIVDRLYLEEAINVNGYKEMKDSINNKSYD